MTSRARRRQRRRRAKRLEVWRERRDDLHEWILSFFDDDACVCFESRKEERARLRRET